MLRVIAFLCLIALSAFGCQARPRAHAAAEPKAIVALTDQTVVYSCPQCGMDYDAAGTCSMCGVALVQTRISYICPADRGPVTHAGSCPRCAANAQVIRTAVATETPGGAAPATQAPGASGSGAPGGS